MKIKSNSINQNKKKSMKNEVLVIGKDTGLSNSKTQELLNILTPLIEIEAKWSKSLDLVVTDENDLITMQSAKGARLVIKNQRIEAEKFLDSKRKEVQDLMSEFVAEDKALLKIKQLISIKAKEYEAHLDKQEKFAENLKNEREEKLFKERYEKMILIHSNPEIFNLKSMTETAFVQLYEGLKKQIEEDERIAKEVFEREREESSKKEMITALINSRMKELYKYKIPNDSLDYDLGNISEKDFNSILDKQKVKYSEYLKIEEEKKKELERREQEIKAKNDELEKAKKLIAEQELSKEKERIANEALLKAPLKERLKVFVNSFDYKEIVVDDEKSKVIYNDIISKFNGFKSWAISQIEKM